jgi:hypothetical protein
MRSNRPVLYSEAAVRALFARMKQELAELDARHAAEQRRLRAELARVTTALAELRAAVHARTKAEAELRELYRMREIRRARAAERDPAQPLN